MQFEAPATPGGYYGHYLRVELDSTPRRVAIPPDDLRRFLGGSGLGAYLMLRERAADIDPLSADAPIAFVFSPLVGSPLTTSAKFAVVCKSPLTDRFNDSLASSGFAIAGKRAGMDALVITGAAPQPAILVVDDDVVRLDPAGELWGKPCGESQTRLRDRYGPEFQVAVIGPAGERGVRFATISHDGRHAGRGGSGAVLGRKRIKAIVVRGSRRCRWADPSQLTALAKNLSERSFGPATAKYRELGTATNLLLFNRLRALPTRNFQQGSFDAAEVLSPESLSQARQRTRTSCAACTIGCEHLYALNKPNHPPDKVRIEYENLFALGPLCAVADADAVLRACKLCDEYGIDTISAGGTIAFAMECSERGLLDAPWLRFGDADALLRAIKEIGERSGLGDRLAEGSRRLASELGSEALPIAPHVKGLEIPGYEPRALQTMGLGFAVGTRGADHNRSGAYEVDFSDQVDRRNLDTSTVPRAIETENRAALIDSLILCKFLRGVFDDLFAEAATMLNAVTGWDTTGDELRQTAARIVSAKKLFNIQCGWQPEEDTLPQRMLEEGLRDDDRACLSPQTLRRAIAAYNTQRGWTSDGWIEPKTITSLQLDDVCEKRR